MYHSVDQSALGECTDGKNRPSVNLSVTIDSKNKPLRRSVRTWGIYEWQKRTIRKFVRGYGWQKRIQRISTRFCVHVYGVQNRISIVADLSS